MNIVRYTAALALASLLSCGGGESLPPDLPSGPDFTGGDDYTVGEVSAVIDPGPGLTFLGLLPLGGDGVGGIEMVALFSTPDSLFIAMPVVESDEAESTAGHGVECWVFPSALGGATSTLIDTNGYGSTAAAAVENYKAKLSERLASGAYPCSSFEGVVGKDL